ncbi:MAG: hypothetical protein E7263_10485 [Lachnospiraceae bacterium]|nr:hypothetical protein [Lachnospiraceae bacterium]
MHLHKSYRLLWVHIIYVDINFGGKLKVGEKLTIGLAGAILIIMLPCLLTLALNGRYRGVTVDMINSGKDVLISSGGENSLMDVEEYIVGVLPGVVDYGVSDQYIQAQAVAVRTKIYFTMGEESVINEDSLNLEYFDDDEYINKYGMENYQAVKNKFEEAVITTAGQVISN